MIKSIFAIAAAGGAAALSLGLAGPAVADYQYWMPVCTGNDIPMNSNCRAGGPQGTPLSGPLPDGNTWSAGGSAGQLPVASPGANPYIPVGVGN